MFKINYKASDEVHGVAIVNSAYEIGDLLAAVARGTKGRIVSVAIQEIREEESDDTVRAD